MGKKTIGTSGLPNRPLAAGSAYVIIPYNVDREQYVSQCYKTNTICLRTESGDFYKNAYIGDNELAMVSFPEKVGEIGSPVFWVSQPRHNTPVVVSVLNIKSAIGKMSEEGQFLLKGVSNDSVVAIDARSKNGASLDILVDSDEVSKVGIKVVGGEDNFLDINVKGNVKILGTKSTKFVAREDFVVGLEDETGVVVSNIKFTKDNGIWEIYSDAGSNGEFLLMGDKTIQQLNKVSNRIDKIIEAISTAVTGVSDGGAIYKANMVALLTPLLSTPLKEEYTDIKSKNVRID